MYDIIFLAWGGLCVLFYRKRFCAFSQMGWVHWDSEFILRVVWRLARRLAGRRDGLD